MNGDLLEHLNADFSRAEKSKQGLQKCGKADNLYA
jgi:hypothetical protein